MTDEIHFGDGMLLERRVKNLEARVRRLSDEYLHLLEHMRMLRRLRSANVRVTEPVEMAAVKNRQIEGETYQDGEVWASRDSLEAWRATQVCDV